MKTKWTLDRDLTKSLHFYAHVGRMSWASVVFYSFFIELIRK